MSRHITIRRPVAFGEHRMMLRPRDDEDQKVLESELEITPGPSELSWTQDVFGNHVTTAHFENRARSFASKALFVSTIRRPSFGEADIEEFARTYPFAYGAEERTGLAASSRRCPPVRRSITGPPSFLRSDGSADTRELLVEMTQTINRTFKHVPRHEKESRTPARPSYSGAGVVGISQCS